MCLKSESHNRYELFELGETKLLARICDYESTVVGMVLEYNYYLLNS